MGPDAFIGLAAANFVACLMPGQNVAFVVSTTTRRGLRAGGAALSGVLIAELIWTALALSVIAGLLEVDAAAVSWLRPACGVALILFGVSLLIAPEAPEAAHPGAGGRGGGLAGGVLVGLANPLALLFFVAILPLFVREPTGGALIAAPAAILLSSAAAMLPWLALSEGLTRRGLRRPLNALCGLALAGLGALATL